MFRLSHFFLAISFFLFSCSSNKITTSWHKPGFKSARYNKVLVMAILLKESDSGFRKEMEKHLVGDLRNIGYDAVSAMERYSQGVFDNLTEKQALEKIKDDGIASIITIVLLNQTQERSFIPSRVSGSSVENHDGYWWEYYHSTQGRINLPGYYVIDTKYFWESNVYMGQNKELVYSVKTDSFDPESTNLLAHQYGKMIVRNMTRNKIY